MLFTSPRSSSGARMTMGSSRSPSRNTPTREPWKPCSNAAATSVRRMPLRLACSSASTGRITFTRWRQSMRMDLASASAAMTAEASPASRRSTAASGPLKRACTLPVEPGPSWKGAV